MATKRKNRNDLSNDSSSSSTVKEKNVRDTLKKTQRSQTSRQYYFLGFLLIVIIAVGGFIWTNEKWSLALKRKMGRAPPVEPPAEEAPREITLAKVTDVLLHKNNMVVTCQSQHAEERRLYPKCAPLWCGRGVMDSVVSPEDAAELLRLAKTGFTYGGSNGGASILDLHSGALSKGDKFINIYSLVANAKDSTPIFSESDFALYTKVKNAIFETILRSFSVQRDLLHLTKPTFFSRMTTKPAQTIHDEYWHIHVDKETYGSFHYTSLLYLNDYGTDFTGGRFVFVDPNNHNITVEPKLGRLLYFTSASENKHFVEKLESGTRYAITVSFTCDATKAIGDPAWPEL